MGLFRLAMSKAPTLFSFRSTTVGRVLQSPTVAAVRYASVYVPKQLEKSGIHLTSNVSYTLIHVRIFGIITNCP